MHVPDHRLLARALASLSMSVGLAPLATSGCGATEPIELPAPSACVKTISTDVAVPVSRAADILIVVDNSSSMLDEQANLASNFLNQDPGACPLQDLTNIPAEFRNPEAQLYAPGGPLANCGFIQLVAAFENDFRVGVITTDVGLCDNRVPELQGGDSWGFRPQRGCLQPDGPSAGAAAAPRKVIARADLLDDDPTNDDFAERFSKTLENISTFGTPIERGLDAMSAFLDPSTNRHPDCARDLENFRRDDAALVVVFVSDEDDCSHGLGDALESFGDENAGEVCGAIDQGTFYANYVNRGGQCYSNPEKLSGVDSYVDVLLATDPSAKVAVIAGGVGAPGAVTPAGCIVGPEGVPEGGDSVCFASRGLSNFTEPGSPCAADTADARDGLPCCVADAGTRYYAFADAVGQRVTDSICNVSFRGSMLNIAAFVGVSDRLKLAEPPDNPDFLLVQLTRADGAEEKLGLLGPTDDCEDVTGFRIVDEVTLQLCGAARLQPGDSVRVRARASALADDDVCRPTNLRVSGGGWNCGATPWAGGAAPGLLVLALLMRGARRRQA